MLCKKTAIWGSKLLQIKEWKDIKMNFISLILNSRIYTRNSLKIVKIDVQINK